MTPFRIRGPQGEDAAFVLSSWLQAARHEGSNEHMSSDVYYAIEHERVRTLIARSGVLIACNPEDEWQIFGWLCYFPANVAHYCYVKSAFRRLGIARALVKEAGLTTPLVCTSTGRLFESWRQGGLVTFDPRWAR